MKRLKELGFKKIKTEPGFHMYELTPARLDLKLKVELKKIIKTNRDARTEKRPSVQARKRTSSQALDK
jgi:hypothetical protein